MDSTLIQLRESFLSREERIRQRRDCDINDFFAEKSQDRKAVVWLLEAPPAHVLQLQKPSIRPYWVN